MSVDFNVLKTRGDEVVFTYFIGRDDQSYYAMNSDLDVGGAGDTEEEAIQHAKEAVFAYLKYAAESDRWHELVPRKMPLGVRMRYHVCCLPATFKNRVCERKLPEPKAELLKFAYGH